MDNTNPGDMFNAFKKKKMEAMTCKPKKAMKKKKKTLRSADAVVKSEQNASHQFKNKKTMKKKKKNWIAGAIKKPGALRKELGVSGGKKIPAKKLNAAAKKGGVEGKRANLAKTLKGFKKNKTEFSPSDLPKNKKIKKTTKKMK